MKQAILVFFLALSIIIPSAESHGKKIGSSIEEITVMYGSTIRMKAVLFNNYLHSHPVRYPEGSGEQSVTGIATDNDYNSLWVIKEAHNKGTKNYKEAVKCGDVIRLQHSLTNKNLHSEEIYQSMVTKGQEVCCFGNHGYGNENDNWVLRCLKKSEGEELKGGDHFELVHQKTQNMLKMSKYYQYSYVNWENCPFIGQLEVSAANKSTVETQFKVIGGVFFREANAQKEEEVVNVNEEL